MGRSFFFIRRKGAMITIVLVAVIQIVLLVAGFIWLAPEFVHSVDTTILRATTWLKLGLEAGVFYTILILKALGWLALFLLPTWIAMIFLMAKRSREGYYVDVVPEGVTVGTPVDRFFIKNEEILKVRRALMFPSTRLVVATPQRRLVLRKLVAARGKPAKKPLFKWLAQPALSRKQVRTSMAQLKQDLENKIK